MPLCAVKITRRFILQQMAVLCCFGICIPCSVFWPLIVLALREVWTFFFGKGKNLAEDIIEKDSAKVESCCSSSKCETSESAGHLGSLTNDINWKKLINSSHPVYVKFTAKWCKPCKEIEPVVLKIAEEVGKKATFINVDVDGYDELAAENGALTIPHFVCFRGGERIDSLGGSNEDNLRAFINKHL